MTAETRQMKPKRHKSLKCAYSTVLYKKVQLSDVLVFLFFSLNAGKHSNLRYHNSNKSQQLLTVQNKIEAQNYNSVKKGFYFLHIHLNDY